jgi:hypothetical protein
VRKGLSFVAGALLVVSALVPAFAEGGCAWSTKQMSVEAPSSARTSTASTGSTAQPSGAQTGG